MLNGEPINTPNISTAPSAPGSPPPTASGQSQQVGFVMGLMALIFAFAFPLAGAIIGGIAVGQARRGGYKNPLALAGLILGIVFTVLIVVVIVVSIVFSVGLFTAVFDVCQQLGTGTHQYNGVTYTCS